MVAMNNRILVIDDDAQVIETYREILVPILDEIDVLADQICLPALESGKSPQFEFEMMSATQGEEGVGLAKMAVEMERPFAVAMIDMRMPPGMDGLQTATELRKLDDRILIVIVTAYTDRSIEEIQSVLDHDAILVYKPFTGEEIFQMARTLCISWNERELKEQAFQEIERLATYPEEHPAPIVRFSDQGELLYRNPHSEALLEVMGVDAIGQQLKGAWLKRICSVYAGERVLNIEISGKDIFFLMTMAPIPHRGYVNCYAQDITRRYLLNRKLTYQARHDSLTGLINRGEFLRKLNLLLRRIQNHGGEHAVLYLDLEHFKEINDTAGHLAGDRILSDLSSALLNEVKDGDVLSRIGGDEFAMLVYDVTVEQARSVGLRICSALSKQNFPWRGSNFQLGVSVGLTMLHQDNLSDAKEVLNRADQACYAAKDLEGGQDRVYVYHQDQAAEGQESDALLLAEEVRQAIENGAFQLHLQPIQAQQEGGEKSFEVLLRMEREGGEIVSPAEFIPSSERFDLMPILDRWVIEHAFKKILLMDEEACSYSINLSGMSLMGEGIELFIRDQLLVTEIDPTSLIFDIEESVAYRQMTVVQQFIQEMHTLGARVAMDDYGSVASSFTSLQKLPVDQIKIDGRLIRGVIHNPVEASIVESMIRVSTVLGMECVAVSVENRETVEALRVMGVGYLQGFHIGKPELWV